MDRWRSSGDVLRWWRSDVLGLTQQKAADRLDVQPSALSNWERDKRHLSLDLGLVDRALEGDGALAGLLWAHGTSEGLDPGHLWTHVFPGDSGPVWVWIRSDVPILALEAEWGVTRIETMLELGENGAFVTVGASVPDSPVVIYLSEPGWADFGSGELPPEIPGAPVLSAVRMFERSSADGAFMELFRTNMMAKLTSRSDEVVQLAEEVPTSVASYVSGINRRIPGEQPTRSWPPQPEGIDAVDRRRFARLREARGISLPRLSARLAEVAGIDVGRDTLRRFETGVGEPHDPMLPVALDHVLGADGRLAMLQIRSGRGSGAVRFPRYWRGPVWLQLDAPHTGAAVVLRRGNWQRNLPTGGNDLVSVHWFDPDVPVRIHADPSVAWSVGIGRRAAAEPIDQNWEPITADVAQQALSETQQAILAALERGQRSPPG